MAFGDVDTLNLLFDKLQYIFSGYNIIRDSFLEIFDQYKQGKISDREFFEKLYEGINRFSALEFLSIKAIFEIKKTLNRSERISKKGFRSSSDQNLSSSPSITSFITQRTLPQAKSFMETSQMEGMTCPNCGFSTKKGAAFCTHCGIKLNRQLKI